MSDPSGYHSFAGGEYTWLNRLRCWLVGHEPHAIPAVDVPELRCFLCSRCNETARVQEVKTNLWFRSVDEWYGAAKYRIRGDRTTLADFR